MLEKYGKCLYDEPMSNHTTYKVGGKAKTIIYPNSINHLVELLKYLKSNNENYRILGKGSNLIFSSKYYDGVLINLELLNNYKIDGNKVTSEAGVSIVKLALETAKNNLSGLEFASGIPGTIGGGVYMNAGAYNSDFSNIIKEVKYLDENFNIKTISNKDCNFEYRDSIFKKNKNMIILETTMELESKPYEEINEIIKTRREKRVASQPLEYPSAGSVFRNPEEAPAGKLIEDLGFKGYQIGGAKVSEKHANFIINAGDATGEDIKELIDYIKKKVKEEYNIDLHLEQEEVNF